MNRLLARLAALASLAEDFVDAMIFAGAEATNRVADDMWARACDKRRAMATARDPLEFCFECKLIDVHEPDCSRRPA